MEFAFMTEPQAGGTYEELSRLARWAESTGFDVFTRSDHYLDDGTSRPTLDALTSLAALATDTRSIRLTVLVAPIGFRHPGSLAKAAATIDEISKGRFELGVGTGWMDSEHHDFGLPYPPWSERFERLEETLQYLRAAFGRTRGGYSGKHYQLADFEVLPAPTGRLPIIVGGSGPRRTPTLAGRYGDELNMYSRPIDAVRTRRDVMRAAAAAAGRDPDSIRLSIFGSPLIGDDRADYRERLGERSAAAGKEPAEYEALLASRNVIRGTVDEARSQLAELQSAGVGRYYIQVYAALADIDTQDVGRTMSLLRD